MEYYIIRSLDWYMEFSKNGIKSADQKFKSGKEIKNISADILTDNREDVRNFARDLQKRTEKPYVYAEVESNNYINYSVDNIKSLWVFLINKNSFEPMNPKSFIA